MSIGVDQEVVGDEKEDCLMATVAIDFDGVIHAYSKGWQDGTIYDDPMPGAFDALAELQARYAVFVHTSRDAGQVAEWLVRRTDGRIRCVTEHPGEEVTWSLQDLSAFNKPPAVSGVSVQRGLFRKFWDDQTKIFVTNRKLPAVAYIDDRGIRFIDWKQALADLAAVV